MDKYKKILYNWLIEVTWKLKLRNATLHLTINIIERYVMNEKIDKEFI